MTSLSPTQSLPSLLALSPRVLRSKHSGLQLPARDDLHPRPPHLVDGRLGVAAVQLHAAAAVNDDVRLEAEVHRVEGAVFDAVVGGQAEQVDVGDLLFLEIFAEAGRLAVRVVEECAVAVDLLVCSLAEDLRHTGTVEDGMELRAARALHAVVGPQD